MRQPLVMDVLSAFTEGPAQGARGLIVRVVTAPVVTNTAVAVTAVVTGEWIDAAGLRHPIPVVPADPGPPPPADLRVGMTQHVVVHDLPDGRLLTESVIKVVVEQDGERHVVQHHDEMVVSKQHSDTDLVIQQADAVHVRLGDDGELSVDLAGSMTVVEQPANPVDLHPDAGVLLVQEQDLVVTDVDDGFADHTEDPDVFGDFEQSARVVDDARDGERDIFGIHQDQARTDVEPAGPPEPFVPDPRLDAGSTQEQAPLWDAIGSWLHLAENPADTRGSTPDGTDPGPS